MRRSWQRSLAKWLRFLTPRRSRPASAAVPRRRCRPALEVLEDRSVPSITPLAFPLGAGGNDEAGAVASDADDNIVVVGHFFDTVDFDPDPNAATLLTSAGGRDSYVAKYSAAGDFLWARRFGGVGAEETLGVAVDSQGNILIGGSFDGTVQFDGVMLSSSGGQDAFVAQLNSAGDVTWAEQFGGTGQEILYGLAVDSANNVLITGVFHNQATFGATILDDVAGADIYVAQLASDGDVNWAVSFGSSDADAGHAIAVDGADNVLVTGIFEDNITFGATTLSITGTREAFVAKLTSAGTVVWARDFAGGDGSGNGVAVDSTNGIVVAGYFTNTASFGNTNLTSAGDRDGFVTKLDADGNFLWARKLGGGGSDNADGVATDSSDNVYIGGQFQSTATFGPIPLTSAGDHDVFVAKLDSTGEFIRAQRFGGTSADLSFSLTVDNAGNSVSAGRFSDTASINGTSIDSAGGIDAFVLKLSEDADVALTAFDLSSTGSDVGRSIIVDAQGNVIVAGEFGGTVDFDPDPVGSLLLTASGVDAFVAKYTALGDLVWVKQFGGGLSDAVSAVRFDSLGNLIVGGTFQDTATFGSTVLNAAGSTDIFVARLDAEGNVSWAKQFGGSNTDTLTDLVVDSADDIVLTGYFRLVASFDAIPLTSSGNLDGFLVRLDSDGAVASALSFGGADFEGGIDLAVDSADNILLTGLFEDTISFGATTLVPQGGRDGFVVSFTSSGVVNWANRFGEHEAQGVGVAVDSADNVLVTGSFMSSVVFGATPLTGAGDRDGFVAKYDNTGAVLWARRFGGASTDEGYDLSADSADNILVGGHFTNGGAFGSLGLAGAGAEDVFLTKLDSAGNFVWAESFGGGGADYSFELAVDAHDNLFDTGAFTGPADFGPLTFTGAGGLDAFVLKRSENTAPTLGGFLQQTIDDDDTVTPFFNSTSGMGATIADADGDTLTVTVTFDAGHGTFTTESLDTSGFSDGMGSYSRTGSPGEVTTALRQLVFDPTNNLTPVGQTTTTVFTVTVNDGSTAPVSVATTSVTATSVNDAPTIGGGITSAIGDKSTVKPFDDGTANAIAIADVDPSEMLLVTVSFSTANGAFTAESLADFEGTAGAHTISGSPTEVTTALRNLVFVPTENQVAVGNAVGTTFTVAVNDQHGDPDVTSTAFVVNATSQNDPPTISGAITSAIGDKSTVKPFDDGTANRITISDVDPVEMLLVTVSFNPANGAFTAESLIGFGGTAGAHTMSGSPSAVTTALRNLVFVPTENQAAVGNVVGTTFTVVANDQHGEPDVTSTNFVVNATSQNDAPTISGDITSAIGDKNSVNPFDDGTANRITIGDVDPSETLTVTVRFTTANGAFTAESLTGFGGTAGAHTVSGSPSAVTTALRNLVFVPTENQVAVGNVSGTTFMVAVNDQHGDPDVTSTNFVVNATSQNDAPTISGDITSAIGDKNSVNPFDDGTANRITIGDVDPVERLTVTVSFNAANGAFTLDSLRDFGGTSGAHTISGSPSEVTTALRNLVFVPTQNQVAVGSTVGTTFTVAVNDQHGDPAVASTNFLVNATSQNDAPTISGTRDSALNERQTVTPFATVTLADADPAETLTVTVSFDPASGSFTNLQATGFSGGNGVVTRSGTPAAVTAALRLLSFDPRDNAALPGGFLRTRFTLSVGDGHGGTVTDSVTDVVATSAKKPQTAVGMTHLMLRRTTLSVTAFQGILAAARDAGVGTNLSVQLVKAPAEGVLALQPDGAFTYTPPRGFLGKATFKVRIIDGHGGLTDPIKIVIKVKKTLP